MKHIVFFILVGFLVASCNKNRQIRGRVLDGLTKKGIEGIPIYLFQLSDSEKALGKAMYTESNEQGYFSFRQPRDQRKFQQVLRCEAVIDKSYYTPFEDSIYLTADNQGETFNFNLYKKHTLHLDLVSDQSYFDEEIRIVLNFSNTQTGVYTTYNILKGSFRPLAQYNKANIFALEGLTTITGYYTVNNGDQIPIETSFDMPIDPFFDQVLEINLP